MIEWWFGLQKEVKDIEWWDSLAATDDNNNPFTTMIVNIVYDPKYLNPSLYPNKKLLIHKLLSHRDEWMTKMNAVTGIDAQKMISAEMSLFGVYNKVVSSLNSKDEEIDMDLLKQFIEYTADLDKLRGQDLRVNLPNLWKRFEGMIEYKGKMNG
jgi:hypothetical protein